MQFKCPFAGTVCDVIILECDNKNDMCKKYIDIYCKICVSDVKQWVNCACLHATWRPLPHISVVIGKRWEIVIGRTKICYDVL